MVNTQILKFKWIVKVLTLLLIFSFSNSYGQLLQWNTFGNAGTETTEPSVFNDPSISAANLTQGAGITPAANGNRFGGSNWWNTGNTAAGNTITEAIAGNDYLQFIITPNAGCSVTPTSFVFSFDRSGTGPSTMVLRSSFDGFTADIGSVAVSASLTNGNTITISGLTNIGTTTFRLYGIGATATGGTGGFDVSSDVVNVQLNGTLNCGTITTGAVATSPFVLATCASTVSGTVAFTSTGIFNAGNVYTAQLSNSAGSFTSAVNIGTLSSTSNSGTVTITIPAGTASGAGYLIRVVASNPNTTGSNSAAFTITQNGDIEPTTQASSSVAGNLGCNSFLLNWVVGNGSNRLIVVRAGAAPTGPSDLISYTANNTYGSGTALGGGFVVYSGTGNSVFVNGLSASTTYHWAIYEFSGNGLCTNYLTSTASTGNITTTACSAAAGITAVYIDACGGGCGFEGNNELIWATSGSYGFKVNSNGPMLHYNLTSPPTTTMISTYTINAANITILNNADGACGTTTFIDPNTLGYIPPNSTILMANNCMCSPSAYDFSGLCDSGPIYVIFGTNASWPCGGTGGIFGNKNCSGTGVDPRFFDLDFTSWGVSTDPIYSYTPCALIGGTDGDIVLTNPAGGPANTYSNSACIVPLIVLPIELVDFYVTKNGDKNDVVWKVASEVNVVYYTIDKSNDGVNFTELASVFSNNATQRITYSVIDDTPFDNITYYRLGTKENNGDVYYHKIISVDEKSSEWNCIHYQQEQNLIIEFKNSVPKNSIIHLFDLSGKLLVEETVKESQTKINTQTFSEGIYFLKISTSYKTKNLKINISKN